MSRKILPLALVLAVVSLLGVAVATANGPTGDTAGPSSPSSASAAAEPVVNIYMTLNGEKAGRIEGSVTSKGHAGWIEVIAYDHEIVSPRDASSGLPTGKRQHKPMTITKTIDKATPLLYRALVNNENLPAVQLEFTRINKGKEEVYFTVKLTNANISGISSERSADTGGLPQEQISFTYQKITWTWTDGGISAEDDWESPVVQLFGLDALKPAA